MSARCKLSADSQTQLTIIKPDDWHAHFRDGAMMRLVSPHTARSFARAIAMPNLNPPLTDRAACTAYAERLAATCEPSMQVLPVLFLRDETTPDEVKQAKPDPENYDGVYGAKLYPRNATTQSEQGVCDYARLAPTFAAMEERALPLLVHAESADDGVDVYDREAVFLERTLTPIRERFPRLKIVVEHVSTRVGVDFVRAFEHTGATITPHHLLYNRNALFQGGLRPHRYCLPPAKREEDRVALVRAACGGDERFFCGTDSAPHDDTRKVCDHGCAGVFNAPTALATYAEIFEAEGALDRLEAFAGVNGAKFYGAPLNTQTLTLRKEEWRVPERIEDGDGLVVTPFRAGEVLRWRIADNAP